MRPRRQATINKSYNDNIDYSSLDDVKTDVKEPSPVVTKANGVNQGKSVTKSTTGPKDAKDSGNGTNIKDQDLMGVNYQPLPGKSDYFSIKLDLTHASLDINQKILHVPKLKMTLTKGDFIYMVSEPPGEPYYIGRIMSFKVREGDHDVIHRSGQGDQVVSGDDIKHYQFQIQWFYRPRDILKSSSESRLLYASMHTDSCPLSSFRGKINVAHKDEIDNLDDYKLVPNNFYFDKLYDRYMMKFYDVLSTSHLLKLANQDSKSKNFLTAMNKRFEYITTEPTVTKFLISGFLSNSCTCEICGQWCSNQDSVTCAECKEFYHMYCLDPPLMKKPSRGFSWHCETCTKKHLQQLKQKKMVMLGADNKSSNIEEIENAQVQQLEDDSVDDDASSSSNTTAITQTTKHSVPRYELQAIEFLNHDPLSFNERRLTEEWTMRYLGMNSKLEDVLDLDDRSPYPRSVTRIGSKYQAHYIPEFIDHPIMYYDPESTTKKKKKDKSPGDDPNTRLKVPPEYESVDVKDYPQWLEPRPKGYVERGTDETSTPLWIPLQQDINSNFENLDAYIEKCKVIAHKLKLLYNSPNFMDAITKIYYDNHGDIDASFDKSSKLTLRQLKEPILKPDDIKKFEEGVAKYGSELYPVYQHVGTVPRWMIVRYYYLWKKTPNGQAIWGNFEGRTKRKVKVVHEEEVENLFYDNDDSGYDDKKIVGKEKTCKYCNTKESIQWYRLTGHEPEDSITGLCFRCAKLWRRYAIVWQDMSELDKLVKKLGKKKLEAEVVKDYEDIIEYVNKNGKGIASKNDTKKDREKDTKKDKDKEKELKKELKKEKEKEKEKVKKEKRKLEEEKAMKRQKMEVIINPIPKNYIVPKELNLTLLKEKTETNKLSYLLDFSKYVSSTTSSPFNITPNVNCDICKHPKDQYKDFHSCESCGISVHLSCIGDHQKPSQWFCDKCINNMNPIYSLNYNCMICNKSDGYLRPIIETGLWCHWTCGLLCERLIFKMVKPLGNVINHNFEIISIGNDQPVKEGDCHICNYKGCKLNCTTCGKKVHASCSEVGFKLIDEPGVKIGNKTGKLVPVLKCCEASSDNGDYSETNNNLQVTNHTDEWCDPRILGQKSSSSKEAIPIIKLFVEELTKPKSIVSPNERYLELVHNYLVVNNKLPNYRPVSHVCKLCMTTTSPMWYAKTNQPVDLDSMQGIDDEHQGEICQSCYANDSQPLEAITQDFVMMVNESIQGQQFGIVDNDDKVNLKKLEI